MKLLVVVAILLLLASLAHCQGGQPPVLPPVPGTVGHCPRRPEELPSLKLISRDHTSVLSVKQTAEGFTLTILKISPPVPKMK